MRGRSGRSDVASQLLTLQLCPGPEPTEAPPRHLTPIKLACSHLPLVSSTVSTCHKAYIIPKIGQDSR